MLSRILWTVPFNFDRDKEFGPVQILDSALDRHPIITSERVRQEFRDTVRAVLAAPDGWAQFGIAFDEQPGNDQALNIQLRALAPSDEGHLSYYIPNEHAVYINFYCWMTGGCFFPDNEIPDLVGLLRSIESKTFRPNPDLDEYRFYVVTHETGHALGLDHPKKKKVPKGTPGRVMMQMTKGIEHISPYALNVRPLPTDNPKLPRNYMSIYRQ